MLFFIIFPLNETKIKEFLKEQLNAISHRNREKRQKTKEKKIKCTKCIRKCYDVINGEVALGSIIKLNKSNNT